MPKTPEPSHGCREQGEPLGRLEESTRSASLPTSAKRHSGEMRFSSYELIRRCRRSRGGVRWGLLNLFALCALVANLRSLGLGSTLVRSPRISHSINATTKGSTDDQGCAHTFTLSAGVWTPPVDFLDKESQRDRALQQSIDSVLFNSTSPAGKAKLHSSFLGFIRVQKTGTTSLLSFLAKHLHSGKKYILRNTEFLGEMDNEWLKNVGTFQKQTMPTCVYGQSLDLVPNVDWGPENCPHLRYRQLLRIWAKSLPFWVAPEGHPLMEAVKHEDLSMSLQTFTIIRDPFDRLVSFFFYAKKIAPKWNNQNTDAQNERIKAGDLVGWMKLLHTEGGSLGMGIPNQYEYFSNDVDKAISLIQGHSPRIFTLLNECFSASLRLLVDKKTSFFSPGSADDFLKSSTSKKNVRNEKASYSGVTEDRLLLLRQNATKWFADDFKFYHAAVEQFRRHLASSSLKPSERQTCRYWNDSSMEVSQFNDGRLRHRYRP